MATEKKTVHKQGPLAAYNNRFKDFWKREENSSFASTPVSNSGSEYQRQHEWRAFSSGQSSSRKQSHDAMRPSPSVEPPQLSAYKLGPSPSPAYWAPGGDPHGDFYQLDGASLPPAQTLRVDSLPLEDIAEMQSSLGHREEQQDNTTVSEASTANDANDQSQITAPPPQHLPPQSSGSQSQSLRRKPVQKRMHPDGNKIVPVFGHFKPPNDVVNHAEIIRNGSEPQLIGNAISPEDEMSHARGEAEYQMAITPPVARREAPPAIALDPAAFQPVPGPEEPQSPSRSMQVNDDLNTITWVSAPRATTGLAPPVPQDPMSSPNVAHRGNDPNNSGREHPLKEVANVPGPGPYDITKPTCSLNLVCYRSGAKGCDLQQLQCILRSKFPTQEGFQLTIDANKNLVHNDEQFFREMRRLFDGQMSSFMRRWFSLKSHKAFRILAYTPTTRPVVVPFDDFVLQEMMFAYLNPDKVESTDDWIHWVFRLRRADKRHAVEFVEGWNSSRIAIAGTVPWLSSCIVGIAWTAAGGDVQSAFTVASFILTSSSIILALLAIISSIESSGRTVM